MSAQPATARPDKTLRLHEALQLLAQAGHAPPDDAQRGSLSWLQAVIDALCDLSCRDALTGLANRRQLELAIGREVDRVARAGEPALGVHLLLGPEFPRMAANLARSLEERRIGVIVAVAERM